MRLSRGVEWATHACATMAALPPEKGLSADDLAAYFEIPAAYLAKQLQALRRAGVLDSVRGQSGGYRLARALDQISLWDVVAAVEGTEPAFRCTEIRQNGPCGIKRADCKRPCEIASAFAEAEHAWRSALERQSLAEVAREFFANADPEHIGDVVQWVADHA